MVESFIFKVGLIDQMTIQQTLPANNKELYRRLLGYVRPYWKAFALAIMAMLATAATEPVFPAIMKYLLDHGFHASDGRLIWLIPVGIVFLFLIRGLLTFSTNYLMAWVSAGIIIDIRRQMFDKMLRLPTYVYHDLSPGKMISRIISDTGHLTDAVTHVLVTVVRESFTAIALLAYLTYLDWKLTLITLIVGPLVAIIAKGFGKRMRRASRHTMETMRLLFHSIEESASAHKVIKIYGAQEQQIQRFRSDTEKLRRAQMREAVPASAITPITHLTASFAVAIIVYMALHQATEQTGVSAGGFVSFITALLMVISPIKQLTTVSSSLHRGLAACESVFAFLDSPEEEDHGTTSLENVKGRIAFKNVHFSYPDSDRLALNNITFEASAGQTIALVGASGSGKTTIGNLIPRFFTPTAGEIQIDGIDIRKLTLTSLRQNISLVSQDIVLFNDTVEANIVFGSREKFNSKEIISAAKAANAWSFIEELPFGLNTLIGEGGAKLSGGQRQRIAIARALLKNAPILILDEATSALDTDSERQVQAALTTLMKNRTTITIAHRLSTIEHADLILVLDKGQIVEFGTHAELLTQGTYYPTLNRMAV
ncbi:lipid A export permease/ATP-binding protein MsbA [Curvibacter sp. APW13]|uniref:lipid A export permease/ATP-binding protein MsbA n=1 Tax=Curvibacter sp. APW13 TaxID=3077236 RepID=UPI0028DF8D16|nr:lipid A export permease/ATP-binding protein MsbA [Curvibacter sp. APW13]MDT8991570.1 lipid A export permease/ATP-binding protein MsbA [Curvibacter sp. APW13]